MKFFISKKGIALLVTLVVVGASAFGAYAYFTSPGSGSGSAYVGTAGPVTITDSWPSGVYLSPGGAPATVSVTVHIAGNSTVYVSQLTGTVSDVPGCYGSWFTVDPTSVNSYLAPGDYTYSTNVSMPQDNADNQNACQGATPTINWSSN